ncbi:MAG: serine/threonine protein kinase [Deltaproteobacteria bacterium]|nr:serine/threonine protein kinase [Deltaproteobacteria bacterium]
MIDGKYRVEVQLGEGGMGVVVAATHLQLDNTVAIKVLKGDALKFAEVPRRFMREARAAGRLRSEHVVKVTDVGQLPSKAPYMVMEMLHGEDVSTQLKHAPLAVGLAVEYILQACEGLAEAHALGMIHRDVKPANLFVTRKPNGMPLVKLLDFGIATAAYGEVDHRLTTTQSVMGSPTYMSPEQLRAARDVDARSDIWSLGVTLYEMVSTKQPFIGPTLTALTLAIVGDPHPRLDYIPPGLMAVIDRCLAKNREDRYANVAELARALAPFAASGELGASMVIGALSQPVAPTLPRFDTDSASFSARPPSTPARTVLPSTDSMPQMSTTSLGAGESAGGLEASRRHRGMWIGLGAFAFVAIVTVAVIARSTGGDTPAASAATKADDKPDTTTTTTSVKVDPTQKTEPPVADDVLVLLRDPVHVRDASGTAELARAIETAVAAQRPRTTTTTTTTQQQQQRRGTPENPYDGTPPAPKKDPPKEREREKEREGPKPCLPSDPKCGL